MDEINYYKIINVAAQAGMILLESNAECYRVEDTMRYILKTSELSITEANATVKSIYLMLDDDEPTFKAITMIRTIKDKSIHLDRIYKVNTISRDLVLRKITIDEASEQLTKLSEVYYSQRTLTLMSILKIPAYTIILGGGLYEFMIALVIGTLVNWVADIKDMIGLNSFLYRLFITSVTAFALTVALKDNEDIKQSVIITATLIPLYPGVSFTNGIRDTLKGDYTSGMARILDAFVTAISLSIGVIMGLYLAGMVVAW